MRNLTPCLWFDNQAEQAASFYVSVFKNSGLGQVTYYGDGAPLPRGTVLTVAFTLEGREFLALNGGPHFKLSEAVSFVVYCDTQTEIDEKWDKLCSDGGRPNQCGWLKDKYGLSWQIVPSIVPELMDARDPARAQRVMQAILQMVKLDIATLQRAAQG